MTRDSILPTSLWIIFGGFFLSSVACGSVDLLTNLLGDDRTSVTFVNNGEFTVEGTVVIGEEQETPQELLEEIGTEISFSVAAGESSSFSRDCDEIQALLLENASLRLIGGIGPETSSDVLRDGDEFGCGDRITFTFDHGELGIGFDVVVTVN